MFARTYVEFIVKIPIPIQPNIKQAGAELCQAQVRLEVIFDVVEEAWS